jgi:hypothetical protein
LFFNAGNDVGEAITIANGPPSSEYAGATRNPASRQLSGYSSNAISLIIVSKGENMRSRLIRTVTMGVVTSLIVSGCILSRGVDHAFLGMTVAHPKYENRKITGLVLIPFSLALDIATFPIQAVLLAVLGDKFPYENADYSMQAGLLNDNPQFQKLSRERKALAQTELRELLQTGAVSINTALVLREDGHWVLMKISDKQRAQLLARSAEATSGKLAFAP